MVAAICRYYPGYTIDRVADELSMGQIEMLLRAISDRPYELVAMVEPKR